MCIAAVARQNARRFYREESSFSQAERLGVAERARRRKLGRRGYSCERPIWTIRDDSLKAIGSCRHAAMVLATATTAGVGTGGLRLKQRQNKPCT